MGRANEPVAALPPGVRELTRIPTLGPKKALALHDELGVASVEDLHGHGPALISTAMRTAEETVPALSTVADCERCAYAASLRRMRETIGDVDILAAAAESGPLMDAFVRLPMVAEVLAARTPAQ